jgi:hypothetical protein
MRYSIANSLVSERNRYFPPISFPFVFDTCSDSSFRLNVFFALSVLTNVVSLIAGPFIYLAMNKSALLASFIGLGFLYSAPPSSSASPWTASKRILLAVKELFAHSFHLGMLLVSLIFTVIGHLENIIRLQYSTKRYGWSYGKASSFSFFS